ncbi:MAG: bifunctional precorrin-2 dehydrogenase/sirohydrochlorin ferrochelatase [Oscillospiraceae bacterium]|nr:bifunctional precorrin-2 dehydrogenase/sirohydrochlorin ferrochelatase [Oscillospiraceae bacterium]
MNRRFPLYINLNGRKVLVYGGGTIAARRCRVLSGFGPQITVIAPEICPEIRALPGIVCREESFSEDHMPEAVLILAATGNRAVNQAIVAAARARGIPVNDASDQNACDFHFPAIALRDPLVVGINAGGKDHGLVARAAAAIRELLDGL